GTGLKAVLKLADWSGTTESAVYAITAGQPAQSQSGIVTDRDSYVTGEDMMVTVTLKDALGRIRTFEVDDGRFTVCSLWPLGNPTRGNSNFEVMLRDGGGGRIRTFEVDDGRFTVCSLWPLG
ncbi:hypothetical protein, partial [Enterobacter mori]